MKVFALALLFIILSGCAEFRSAAWATLHTQAHKELDTGFDKADKDGNGSLDKAEAHEALDGALEPIRDWVVGD